MAWACGMGIIFFQACSECRQVQSLPPPCFSKTYIMKYNGLVCLLLLDLYLATNFSATLWRSLELRTRNPRNQNRPRERGTQRDLPEDWTVLVSNFDHSWLFKSSNTIEYRFRNIQEFFLAAVRWLILETVIECNWQKGHMDVADRVRSRSHSVPEEEEPRKGSSSSAGTSSELRTQERCWSNDFSRSFYNEMLSTHWIRGSPTGLPFQNLDTNFAGLVLQVLWLKRKFWRLHCISATDACRYQMFTVLKYTLSEIVSIHSNTSW